MLQSPLKLSWFRLAYFGYGLIAARLGLSRARFDDIDVFVAPVRASLQELGITVSAPECVAEIERFLPVDADARGLDAATYALLSFVRFLHRAALRRRRFVAPDLALPSVGLASAEDDAEEAQRMTHFLSSHGIARIAHPQDAAPGTRLLVLLSLGAFASAAFWQQVAAWKAQPVRPMVVCLMPKAALYRDAPAGVPDDLWAWLGDNVAVDIGAGNDRYVVLLRALDSPDPRQWWWQGGDAIEIGLAVDVLGEGLPRPRAPREAVAGSAAAQPAVYPFALDGTLLSAALIASAHRADGEPPDRHDRYYGICQTLMQQRQRTPSEAYALAWFMLIYRSWRAFADPGEDAQAAERELLQALFALGIGSVSGEVPAFLQAFGALPWERPATSIDALDERVAAWLALVHHLANAALARGQRMRLQHPAATCFISYARPDEALAQELVAHLEAQGADVWWDLHAITLGAPLDAELGAAVQAASCLYLIATPAAARSAYVRLEVETAARRGLRIVPIAPEGRMPDGFEAMSAAGVAAFEPLVPAGPSERAAAFDAALAMLQRTPAEQLAWLRRQIPFQGVRGHLARARAALADASPEAT